MKVLASLILMSTLLISETLDSIVDVEGNHNVINQTFNHGLSSRVIHKFIKPYEDRIDILQKKLNRTVSIEKKYQLLKEIDEAKQIMNQKTKEIMELNQFILSTNLKVVDKAKQIYEEKGLTSVLDYFRSKPYTKFEKNAQKNMKELSGGYKLFAKFLVLHDNYKEASNAYKKALQYERSHDNLFEYANFLSEQNLYDEAIVYYKESLKKREELTKVNPSKYHPLVLIILNNLANLYNARGQLKIAKNYYEDALSIRKKNDSNEKDEYIFVSILNNLGILYTKEKEFDKAKKVHIKALDVFTKLNTKHLYDLELAITLDNLGNLDNIEKKYKGAKDYYMDALEIYKKLDKKDSKKYKPYLANGLNNLGALYKSLKQLDIAEKYYKQALKIYQELAKNNPLAYNLYLPIIWSNLAILHKEKSISFFKKSLLSYKELEKEDFVRYNESVLELENGLKGMGTISNINLMVNRVEKISFERKINNINEEVNKLKNSSRVESNLIGISEEVISTPHTGLIGADEVETRVIGSKTQISNPDIEMDSVGVVVGSSGSFVMGSE